MKIAVGLSGGIDSAGTALKLKRQGYDVFGITMHLFDHQTEELLNAQKVAKQIGIDHHIVDFREDFDRLVITPFIKAYESGQTPNPCLYCNKTLKYGKLIERALSLGADKFATGHYARCTFDDNSQQYVILKAKHLPKDQSYNLYHLNQDQLSKLIFPLGTAHSKASVREEYAHLDQGQSSKSDSQGICFIERGGQALYLKSRGSSASQPGYFVNREGKILGKHLGIANYTIGQKRKLGIITDPDQVVVEINPLRNQVVIGNEKDLLSETLSLSQFNFVFDPQVDTMPVTLKTSQWSPLYEGQLTITAKNDLGASVQIVLDTPVRGLTPGQAIVCYQGDCLIGGGIYQA